VNVNVNDLITAVKTGKQLTPEQLDAIRKGLLVVDAGQEPFLFNALQRLAFVAAEKGRVDVIEALAACPDKAVRDCLTAPNMLGERPAHRAAACGQVGVIRALDGSPFEDVWISLTKRDMWGLLPVHHAAENHHEDVIEALAASPHEAVRDSVIERTPRMRLPSHLAFLAEAQNDSLELEDPVYKRELLAVVSCDYSALLARPVPGEAASPAAAGRAVPEP